MKRKKRDPVSRETFEGVLRAIQQTLGWKWNALAAAMGVSTRTLVRWVYHRDMPAPARRVAIVAALRDLPTDLVARLAASLDVDPRIGGVAPPAAPADVPERARAILDAAIYAAADAMNARASDLRTALGPILSAIAELGIDARAARAIVERSRK